MLASFQTDALVNGKFLDLNQGYFYYKATRTF